MNDIQSAELRLLKSLCTFLDAHNLRYYLIFGTLLGAVRHKGFIPWDDDVDIAMPREDYNKLLDFPDTAFGEPFRLYEITRTNNHYEIFAKYIDTSISIHLIEPQRTLSIDEHIWIDIFPIDGLPDSKIKVFFIKILSIVLRELYKLSISDFTFKRNKLKNILIKYIFTRFSYKKLYYSIVKLISRYSFYDSKVVASITEMNKSFYVYQKTIFGNPVKITFEDNAFNAPEQTSKYLEIQYGDYMKLPPESERKTHQFIMKDKSNL